MIKTSVNTKGELLTNTVVEDLDNPFDSATTITMQQQIDISSCVKQDDNLLEIHINGDTTTKLLSLESEPQVEVDNNPRRSQFEIDAKLSETSASICAVMDNQKMALTMSTDEETMASLSKSKVLRLFTEDGKEVTIEMQIEQD